MGEIETDHTEIYRRIAELEQNHAGLSVNITTLIKSVDETKQEIKTSSLLLTRVCNQMENDQRNSTKALDDIAGIIKRHDRLLFGDDDNRGMKARVDNLDDTVSDWRTSIRTLWTAIFGIFAKFIFDVFNSINGHK